MAGTCENCQQPMPEPKTEWLTRKQVVDNFHFDPMQYEADVKSKLQQMRLTDETPVTVRVFLKTDVEAKAAEIQR